MLPFKVTLANPSNPALTPGAFAQQQARHEMLRKTKLAKMAEEAAAVAKLYGALVESFATLDPEEDPDDPDAIDRFVAPFVEKGQGWTFNAPCPVDLLRSCYRACGAAGRDQPLGMFKPRKAGARVLFEEALTSYAGARRGRGGQGHPRPQGQARPRGRREGAPDLHQGNRRSAPEEAAR